MAAAVRRLSSSLQSRVRREVPEWFSSSPYYHIYGFRHGRPWNRSIQPFQEAADGSGKIRAPFMPAIEHHDFDLHAGSTQTLLVVGGLLQRVPLIAYSSADQDRRNSRECRIVHLGRNVSTQSNHSADRP